jgi:hypothetical protein
VLHQEADGKWQSLSSVYLGEEFADYWDTYAPDDLKGWRLPFLSSLFVPGVVQVWSGLFVSTAENWSVLVRSPANAGITTSYSCYEGLIETDRYKPCPLFMNIKLLATDRDIVLSRNKPLFQVQPIPREAYDEDAMSYVEYEGLRPRADGMAGMSNADWEGLRRTTRSVQAVRDSHRIGGYGANVRRRDKSE